MNVLICDDEEQIARDLGKRAERLLPEARVHVFASGKELLQSGCRPDICFLDIRMPGMDGMETARLLRAREKDAALIFVTGIKEYVFQAFDVGAFHYLVKPFSDKKFAEVLLKAAGEWKERTGRAKGENPETDSTETERPALLVKNGGNSRRIFLEDIIYSEVFNRTVVIHERGRSTKYYGKLSDLEKTAGVSFFRTHRSYLVNLKYVEGYDCGHVILTEGEALLAKAKYPMFVKAFLRYHKRG